MANGDDYWFQGLPANTAIPKTLHGHTVADHQAELASEAQLRAKDNQRVGLRMAADDAARSAAWRGRMAILDE